MNACYIYAKLACIIATWRLGLLAALVARHNVT